jgi:orotidine-5'-phosphate decarboxylase
MKFKEILHESQADIVSNLIKDMKSGDINPTVTKAILNYVQAGI